MQVKTCAFQIATPDGHMRWSVSLSTNGGNQSWNRVAKTFDPSRFDLLFVLTGDGRRWCIPASAIEGSHSVALGGSKYAEFEIQSTTPIDDLIYGAGGTPLDSQTPPGEYPSGQRTATVNRQAQPSQVRILSPPSTQSGDDSRFERTLGRSGQTIVRRNRQTTIPKQPFVQAGLVVGERLRWRADGLGRIIVERIDPVAKLFGDDA